MNAFQLIDEIGKLGVEWEVTSWCHSIRSGNQCPLEVYVEGDLTFSEKITKLLQRGVDIMVIRTVSMASNGYFYRDNPEIMKYRNYMIRVWKFKPDAKARLKEGWES